MPKPVSITVAAKLAVSLGGYKRLITRPPPPKPGSDAASMPVLEPQMVGAGTLSLLVSLTEQGSLRLAGAAAAATLNRKHHGFVPIARL